LQSQHCQTDKLYLWQSIAPQGIVGLLHQLRPSPGSCSGIWRCRCSKEKTWSFDMRGSGAIYPAIGHSMPTTWTCTVIGCALGMYEYTLELFSMRWRCQSSRARPKTVWEIYPPKWVWKNVPFDKQEICEYSMERGRHDLSFFNSEINDLKKTKKMRDYDDLPPTRVWIYFKSQKSQSSSSRTGLYLKNPVFRIKVE